MTTTFTTTTKRVLNVYVVTRWSDPAGPAGMIDVPNLGVHSSLKKAVSHYCAVLRERQREGCKVFWDIVCEDPGIGRPKLEVRRAMVDHGGYTEELLIEQWQVTRGNGMLNRSIVHGGR